MNAMYPDPFEVDTQSDEDEVIELDSSSDDVSIDSESDEISEEF